MGLLAAGNFGNLRRLVGGYDSLKNRDGRLRNRPTVMVVVLPRVVLVGRVDRATVAALPSLRTMRPLTIPRILLSKSRLVLVMTLLTMTREGPKEPKTAT